MTECLLGVFDIEPITSAPEIFPGAVLEVWLADHEIPEPCLVIEEAVPDRPINPCGEIDLFGQEIIGQRRWRVLVRDEVVVLFVDRIFNPGTATPPPPAIKFPRINRIPSTLFANELISIQPMSLPSGLLFYLDYKYNKNSASAVEGGVQPRHTKEKNVVSRQGQGNLRRRGAGSNRGAARHATTSRRVTARRACVSHLPGRHLLRSSWQSRPARAACGP